MSLPTAVFLDTSVFAGQQYNFGSTAFTSFVTVAKDRGVKLLLPDPTKREVMRQIRERSEDALKALDSARRKAPFLAKWRHYPPPLDPGRANWEVRGLAESEWAAFVKQFEVVPLGYEGLNLNEIMNWYDAPRAPFAEGKKRKEFPDAFAVAALALYASKAGCYIAVVSADEDFKGACTHYPMLLHFPTLPALTELLLADGASIETIRGLIGDSEATLEEAVIEAASDLHFFHANDQFEDIDDVDRMSFAPRDVRVVGLGINECTITFSGELSYRVRLRWKEDDYGYDSHGWQPEHVEDSAELSGTAKLCLAPDLTDVTAITLLELDDQEIEVTRSGSLVPAIAGHVLTNGLNVVAVGLYPRIPGITTEGFQPWWLTALGVLVAAGGIVAFHRAARAARNASVEEVLAS